EAGFGRQVEHERTRAEQDAVRHAVHAGHVQGTVVVVQRLQVLFAGAFGVFGQVPALEAAAAGLQVQFTHGERAVGAAGEVVFDAAVHVRRPAQGRTRL